MSIKIHIAVALISATSAVLILLLLVIAQNARSSTESLSYHRQALAFLDVDTNIPRMDYERSGVNPGNSHP